MARTNHLTESTWGIRTEAALAVLPVARDVGDQFVIGCCLRVLNADRLGWRRHGRKHDLDVVFAFADALKE
jgi:hypothetical protein